MSQLRESVRAFLLTATHDELVEEAEISRERGDHQREAFIHELLSEEAELVGIDLYCDADEEV